jgi:23S rRNA (adenine2030-N6)-methyltransferase
MLDYLTRKDKPVSYIETHSGRGVYDLSADEAVKTGEAAQGIEKVSRWFAAAHPYARALEAVRAKHGASAYAGSPAIAQALLRPTDSLHLAELHPKEHAALRKALWARNTRNYHQDGWDLVQSLCPPTPRRGLLLVDPSYEIKSDYELIPKVFQQLHRKWNVGILALWYPLLDGGAHGPMLKALSAQFPEALRHEVTFPPARDGHRMKGSGMFIVNPPFGLDGEASRLSGLFAKL